MRKSPGAIDRWVEETAPSTDFRRWFGQTPAGGRNSRSVIGAQLTKNSYDAREEA